MKQSIFVKNTPINEKRISFIETILSRLMRRSVKKASAIITPYPISNCVIGEDVKGEILKYMFCSKGVIKKGLIYLDRRVRSGAEVSISLKSDIGGESMSYIVTSKQMIVKPDMDVYSSDRLTISIVPIDPEEKLKEVWLSFLWVPEVDDSEIKSFLINELEKSIEEPVEEEIDA